MSIFSLADIIFFIVFDPVSNEILYTKYNFNFDLYQTDFNIQPNNKLTIFSDFLQRNNTTYDKPYSVSEELKKYFTPITSEIINYTLKY